MIPSRGPLLLATALLAPAALGCGRGGDLTPVAGRVFYRGQPLPGGTIVFTPDADRGGRGPLACGEIGADGRYSLRTEGRPGAVAGWHRVSIAPPAAVTELPRRYHDPAQSGLLCEVGPGKPPEHDFSLDDDERASP